MIVSSAILGANYGLSLKQRSCFGGENVFLKLCFLQGNWGSWEAKKDGGKGGKKRQEEGSAQDKAAEGQK